MKLPTIGTKTKYAIAGVSVVVAFATGRFTAQKAEVKNETVATKDIHEGTQANTHTQTTITTVKTPDGTTKIVEQINQVKDVDTTTVTKTDQTTTQDVIPPKTNTLNVSALVGNDFSKGIFQPAYGVSVSKQILGPVTVGAFGLTSGVVGLSIGLNF